uniref:angio-associated migratory cell protein-like n=1 Tax=Styela clava TaxID=7725 RepID=UPI00193AB3AF|nr:angio-associated migratory cell protein-like [Styela clava]
MDDDNNDDIIYAEDVLEEVTLGDNNEEVLADGIEETTLDDYDADVDYDDDDNDDDQENIDEKCVVIFKKHNEPVFVVDVDKSSSIVVSGGEDEIAYVWTLDDGEILFTCVDHKDSVTCAQFNADSSLLATGDMSGVIQVWSIASKSSIWKFETSDLEWIKWHPVAPILLAGTNDGQCWMWQIPKDNCKTFASHGVSTTSGCFLPDGKTAVIGYGDGTVKGIDLKTTNIIFNTKGKDAHTAGISDLNISADGTLIGTASVDGTCKLSSTSTGKVSATYNCNNNKTENKENIDEESDIESVECVAFSLKLHLLATGCLNGYLHIWDYKTGLLRHSCKHEQGVTKLCWEPSSRGGFVVYTGCLDNKCRSWDARTGQLIDTFTGHKGHIYDIKISSNGEKLISSSEDGTVRVFKAK